MIWDRNTLCKILNINLQHSTYSKFNNVLTHSKYVSKGDIFIALKGSNNDGHDFIHEALSKGAYLVLFSDTTKAHDLNANICFRLDNLEEHILKLAKYKRQRSKAKFIGITGSAGKTTTKDLLFNVLSKNFKLFKSYQSFNWQYYVISCLASIPDDIEFAIFEFGMCNKGEILESTKLFKLDIVVINNVFPAHIGYFNSVEEIAHAKSEILQNINPKESTAIINFDNYKEVFSYYIKSLRISNVIVFGKEKESQIELEYYSSFLDNHEFKSKFIYRIKEKKYTIIRNNIHKSVGENFRSVLGVILALGLDVEEYIEKFVQFDPQLGRGKVISVQSNKNKNENLYLYCDYYNSNPVALQKSLISLGNMPQKYKISIIGDMLELGENSIQFHLEIIKFIKKANIQTLILVGEEVKCIFAATQNIKELKSYLFENVEELIPKLDELLPPGSMTLIKGSRKTGLEKILMNWNIKHDI